MATCTAGPPKAVVPSLSMSPTTSPRWRRCPGTGSVAAGWLEQLDEIAGRVDGEDLCAAGTGDHVVAELDAGGLEAGDLCVEVVDDEVDTVPPAGSGLLAVGHGTTGGALRARQQQSEVAALHVGER